MLRARKAWAVARKEITDILRDRRTVFMAIVFPLILYPLLIIGIIQVAVVQETSAARREYVVAVSGGRYAPWLVENLEKEDALEIVEFEKDSGRFGHKDAAATVIFPADFRTAMSREATARVKLFYDSADPASAAAAAKAAEVISSGSNYVLNKRLERMELDKEFTEPIALDRMDVATARQRGAFHVGRLLSFLLVVLCMMGALYPAIDAVAGEKERGTLETLLSIPASRLEILAGKYAAVFAMSIASVVSNFVSLSATMVMVNYLLKSAAPGEAPMDFTVPVSAFVLFVPALVPLAAFFSAVTLGVACFARTTREGQYYLGPLYAAALPLTALALGGVRLNYLTALVPVLSMALFLKEGLLGTLPAGPAAVAVAATCAYAAVALKWAAGVFSREEVLFSSPAAGESAPAGRGVARPSHALFVWAVSVILFFFFGPRLEAKYGLGRPWVAAVIYLLILGPAVAYAALWRLDWRKVFPLGPVTARKFASAALFVPAAAFLSMAAKAVQSYFLSAPVSLAQTSTVQETSIWALFVSIAVLPAVCEELFYRGFVLQSLSRRLAPAAAIVISAALFSIAHVNPYTVLPLFVLGLVLAVAARATGGLLTPMIVHFAYNCFSLSVLVRAVRLDILTRQITGAWQAVVLFGLVGAGLAAVWAAIAVARPSRK